MVNIWEKAISILVGNLNSGRSYLITTVMDQFWKKPPLGQAVFIYLKPVMTTNQEGTLLLEQFSVTGGRIWKSKNLPKNAFVKILCPNKKSLTFNQYW